MRRPRIYLTRIPEDMAERMEKKGPGVEVEGGQQKGSGD